MQAHAHDGSERGSQNIHQVVADQHQAEQAVGAPQQLFHPAGGAAAIFRLMAQLIAVKRHHAGFRPGEPGGNQHHNDQNNNKGGG